MGSTGGRPGSISDDFRQFVLEFLRGDAMFSAYCLPMRFTFIARRADHFSDVSVTGLAERHNKGEVSRGDEWKAV